MHKLILVTIIIACSFSAFAQSEQSQPPKDTFVIDKAEEEEIFMSVEQMPEFTGGVESLRKYLSKNIIYPEKAKKDNVQGSVIVRFVITTTGKITNIEVLGKLGAGCDEETLRVVQNMPDWRPGRQNGRPVNVYYVLPIKFKLGKD